ncbi:hypothetical protein PVAP13_5NG632036 [Panicum virgatum]|uniref:Uncharacterized protein n=1 Tax=Panicum virgatum TaxID=38727 RepID=A0A8T0S8L9_PANVG|nr:hypothetical protein PVAP13_5NG632036 [Panicum virgatum]
MSGAATMLARLTKNTTMDVHCSGSFTQFRPPSIYRIKTW